MVVYCTKCSFFMIKLQCQQFLFPYQSLKREQPKFGLLILGWWTQQPAVFTPTVTTAFFPIFEWKVSVKLTVLLWYTVQLWVRGVPLNFRSMGWRKSAFLLCINGYITRINISQETSIKTTAYHSIKRLFSDTQISTGFVRAVFIPVLVQPRIPTSLEFSCYLRDTCHDEICPNSVYLIFCAFMFFFNESHFLEFVNLLHMLQYVSTIRAQALGYRVISFSGTRTHVKSTNQKPCCRADGQQEIDHSRNPVLPELLLVRRDSESTSDP